MYHIYWSRNRSIIVHLCINMHKIYIKYVVYAYYVLFVHIYAYILKNHAPKYHIRRDICHLGMEIKSIYRYRGVWFYWSRNRSIIHIFWAKCSKMMSLELFEKVRFLGPTILTIYAKIVELVEFWEKVQKNSTLHFFQKIFENLRVIVYIFH